MLCGRGSILDNGLTVYFASDCHTQAPPETAVIKEAAEASYQGKEQATSPSDGRS